MPTDEASGHVDGWHIQLYIDGRPLTTSAEPAFRAALGAVHSSTSGWPQRPGSRSARHLLSADAGGDIDLSTMPSDLVDRIRLAWAAADPQETCVVHGDAGPGNALLLPDGRCALIDWDEARTDDPHFDLATSSDPV